MPDQNEEKAQEWATKIATQLATNAADERRLWDMTDEVSPNWIDNDDADVNGHQAGLLVVRQRFASTPEQIAARVFMANHAEENIALPIERTKSFQMLVKAARIARGLED